MINMTISTVSTGDKWAPERRVRHGCGSVLVGRRDVDAEEDAAVEGGHAGGAGGAGSQDAGGEHRHGASGRRRVPAAVPACNNAQPSVEC